MSKTVFIGLGSNLNQPVQQILQAIKRIKALSDVSLEDVSSLYETPPMGPQDQPHYVNAVAKITTTLEPLALLDALQTIETIQGRTRESARWGARTLDLDILLYADKCSTDPKLTLPHPGLHLRSFVLYPLFEIEHQLDIPNLGSVQQLIERLNESSPCIISAETLEKQPSVC
ncbi:MAG: 2-amino-4-hydroxy-6-hydroxymethyldihydropteridine diphosphokinase [Cycloclasticus sp.]|jgi:2-amino-4-hydroxy-6-hydroxymethyldihydropteridine diphosphokinase|tara:strand:- start:2060 stop:2578 length:519 start_codon:yes stop_codon:yes gene_type:complete